MIFLTGDVHQNINKHFQQRISGPELNCAKKYLEILKKNKVPCTLFLNGSLLDNQPKKVKELLKFNVEIGGHTYDNFGTMNIFKSYIYRKIWRCIYGPKNYQRKDIARTKKAFQKLGLKMDSWRTHAYGSNQTTFKILKEQGVKYVSDLLGNTQPFKEKGIIHMPINIPPDNNTIAYSILRPENTDPFVGCKAGRIEAYEWEDILKKRVIENEKNKKASVILLHPATMQTIDNFKTFQNIAKFSSKYECFKISEFKTTWKPQTG